MRYRILPYRQGSRGARALADALGGRVLKLEGSAYTPRQSDCIVNWGNIGYIREPLLGRLEQFKNDPCLIRRASNKRTFFQTMTNGGYNEIIPRYWTDRGGIPDDCFPIVCRTVLAGHSGDGIVMADTREQLVAAPLYVQYLKKKDEYRVHVGRLPSGELTILAVQRKARRTAIPSNEVNWQIRNHNNGFIFQREGIDPPVSVIDAARNTLGCLGLDFGAVDVIWNANLQRAYVLEINTAPGLEGQTVEDYAQFFRRFAEGNNGVSTPADPYSIDVV